MNQYPASNFHDLNLDWLLQQMKNCLAEWNETKTDWENLEADNTEFKVFVTNYLQNLDVTDEISAKIDAMIADGTFLELLTEDTGEGSPLSDTVGAWLAAHITQETGYVIDDTLTVQGAAADAKAAGDAIANLNGASIQKYTIFVNDSTAWGTFGNDFDGLTPNRVYAIQALSNTAHSPIEGFIGYVLTYKFTTGNTKGMQVAYERTSTRIFVRQGISSTWGDWYEYNPTSAIVAPINSAIALLNKYVDVLESYFVCGKNLVNPDDALNIRESAYVNESVINSLSTWKCIAIPIDASKGHISLNLASVYAMFYSDYEFGSLSTVTVPSNLTGYISGVIVTSSNVSDRDNIAIPSNAKWVLVSCSKTAFPTLQVEYSSKHTTFESFQMFLNDVKIRDHTEVNLTDYTNLRECLATIQPTAENHYIVNIPDGTYNIESYYTAEEKADASFRGLFIPDYVTLRGVGSREHTILSYTSESALDKISTLNIYNVAGLENLTVEGSNVRYCVHDDFATSYDGVNVRKVKNCIFRKTVNGSYATAYGAGMKGNAQWEFENCVFIGNGATFRGFSIHNNSPVAKDSNITLKNCRFVNTDVSSQEIRVDSFNTNVTGLTYLYLIGCGFNNASKILLTESSASDYGAGIKAKVSGYANTFGNSDVTITVTDGVDYSGNVDLI